MSTPDQKVAVITGASQGIGAGLVDGYRKAGYAVVATSRGIAPSQDPDVLTVQGDIADPATAERVAGAAIERFGRIDSLINNAGIFVSKPFHEYTQADYDAVTGVNTSGFFRISQLAIAQMLRQGGGGHVVQVTTSLVEHPNSALPSVLASLTKGGLQAATKALAIEYAGRGIRSNAVALGVIKTPMHPVEYHDTLGALHPVGRMGDIQDVVDAVLYLENARFVTGEIMAVDGGQSAGH
ncbi:SDR family NAD(P)-dependent oxidoreductase [Streptomyces chromofuscus]|uniref:SDR family NAD(P)-dependent oxidoreductase n=1 Tax=Streptomyces chromofuscus TaxID=42881 RepID=UPI001676FDDB|nr:SDR family oxidoreductase [Streptomyces chromofuscus]GGT03452.1 gluconate 5-dehydrogenase [Streptomyces chromofuscus]